jgi:Trp operon repressor
MEQGSLPLTGLSEAQQTQALERFRIIRPALDKESTQAQIAHTQQISLYTRERWIWQTQPAQIKGRLAAFLLLPFS